MTTAAVRAIGIVSAFELKRKATDMNFVYVDESIHERGGFIVAAAVYAPEPLDGAVFDALADCGFTPKVDEFKSSMTMVGNPAAQELRGRLRYMLMERCKVAVALCSIAERPQLMDLTFALIRRLNTNPPITPGIIYLDDGMRLAKTEPPIGWTVEPRCNSKEIGGIQLADCAAHIVSMILLSEMGIVNKMVPAGEYYPEPEVEMAWQLWTSLRYALSGGQPVGGYDADGWCEPMMVPFGLHITDSCSDAVKAAVEARLSSVWVGCIH